MGRFATQRDSNMSEKRPPPRGGGEPQLQNKRGRLTTLRDNNEAKQILFEGVFK